MAVMSTSPNIPDGYLDRLLAYDPYMPWEAARDGINAVTGAAASVGTAAAGAVSDVGTAAANAIPEAAERSTDNLKEAALYAVGGVAVLGVGAAIAAKTGALKALGKLLPF
jgi:hypothetical protein